MRALAALLLVLAPSAATGQSSLAQAMQSGSDAYSICRSYESGTNGWVCLSWINGAVQAAGGTTSLNPEYPDFCTPAYGGSIGQYADVFVQYLGDNPGRRHLPAIMLFREAMARAFPCP